MILALEYRKVKRTGFYPAFFIGGILAASMPVINMAVRSEMYTTQNSTPILILLRANWEIMSMLNLLLIVVCTCLLYNTEYADNALQKMKSLPIQESTIFNGKLLLTIFMCIIALTIEAVSITFCYFYWFKTANNFKTELIETEFLTALLKNFGYEFLLMLPCIMISLLISSACKNMWLSLGIGVICIFTATLIRRNDFILSLFPYAMPFQIFAETDTTNIRKYIYAAILEIFTLGIAEFIFIKIRRSFE